MVLLTWDAVYRAPPTNTPGGIGYTRSRFMDSPYSFLKIHYGVHQLNLTTTLKTKTKFDDAPQTHYSMFDRALTCGFLLSNRHNHQPGVAIFCL